MKRETIAAAILTFSLASQASAFFWSDNPVRAAIKDGSFDLTLAEYKDSKVEDRAELVAAYVEMQDLPIADVDLYITCMGEYAGTKSENLKFETVFAWCRGDAENNRAAFELHFNELDARDYWAEANVMCQRYVETQLVSPSSAKFRSGLKPTYKGRQRYLVNSYVDAQNGFGAMVRTYFVCDMQYTGPEGGSGIDYLNWDMLDFQAQQ